MTETEVKQVMKQDRFKLFVENFFVYGMGTVLLKAIPLIMAPILTRMIPDTSDYGAVDIYSTIISFGGAVAIMGMYDATIRLFFDKEDILYRKSTTSTSAAIVLINSIFMAIVFWAFQKPLGTVFFASSQYSYLVYLAGFTIAFQSMAACVTWPFRFFNNRKLYIIYNLTTSILSYTFTLLLLFNGLTVTAIPISNTLVAILSFVILAIYNRKHYSPSLIQWSIAKELLKIGVPLVPTFLIYWIFNSIDKIMITHMIGTAANGIFAVGAKLAMVSQIIYSAFSAGWSHFTFSTMKDIDHTKTISNIFEWLAAISFFLFALSLFFYKSVFKFLFEGNYVQGYQVFPYLFLSPLVLMLFQICSNEFIVIKKSYLSTLSLLLGAIFNVALNYFGILLYGIKGAALASLIGYVVSLLGVLFITQIMKLIYIRYRFWVISILVAMLVSIVFFMDNIVPYILAGIIIFVILLFYFRDIKLLLTKLKGNLQ